MNIEICWKTMLMSVLSNLAFNQVCEYLKGKRTTFNFPYELQGTDFQKKVWDALCQCPGKLKL